MKIILCYLYLCVVAFTPINRVKFNESKKSYEKISIQLGVLQPCLVVDSVNKNNDVFCKISNGLSNEKINTIYKNVYVLRKINNTYYIKDTISVINNSFILYLKRGEKKMVLLEDSYREGNCYSIKL